MSKKLVNKKMSSKSRVIMLVFGIFLLSAFVGTASATTWYVDDDGGADFTHIQDAINNASAGDTIFVYSGTYYENIILKDGVKVQGKGADVTTIDGRGAGSVWSPQSSGTSAELEDVDFINVDTGWAVGTGDTILQTVNGGTTWAPQSTGTGDHLVAVDFVDATNGWVIGWGWEGVDLCSKILHTADGGATWSIQLEGISELLRDITFIDTETGWVVGDGGTILHTTDGGVTWSAQNSSTSAGSAVAFADPNNGWAVGQTIIHTSDGGTTWSLQSSPTPITLLGVCFIDANIGWAVGYGGTIIHTTNGGATWLLQPDVTGHQLNNVAFVNANEGWAVGGGGTILHTDDGGASWSSQASYTLDHLDAVVFIDPYNGWTVGSGGTILKYAPPVYVETATGTGIAYFWTDSGTIEDLEAVDEATLPTEGKPHLGFPHGFFSFNITGLTPGQTVVVTITLPDNVPLGTQYWKYHASEGGWIQIPMGSDDGDNIITITLVDGGLGDDDCVADGVIVDQGGPGVPIPWPELTKAAPTSVAPGGTITYTILYSNLGLVVLTNVTITENYPVGVTFVSAVPAPDPGTNNKWTIGTLPANASGTITIKVQVPESRELTFTESGGVTGEGFVMVNKDLSTEQEPYRLKNVVTITCAEKGPVSASASTTVGGVPGTSLSITEHGSGIYESEEILNFGTKNKSIRLQKSTEAEYQPTSFNFSDGFVVNFATRWMQNICIKNTVLDDAMHKKIKDATYIKDDTRTEVGEYGTEMAFESSFYGAAHIGAVSKDVTTSEDYIGEFELFWAAKEECRYLFNWSRVPGNDSENMIRFLVDNPDINLYWAENATITKSDDDRVITISTDWRSAEIILAANNKTAAVKVGNETIYVLEVRTEDGYLNVYDCRLKEMSESVTGEGYVMVDKELTSGHIQVVEHGSGIYSSDTCFDLQRLNKSTEAEYKPTTFNFSDDFGVNFSSKWVQGICAKDKKAGTAIHKKISDATFMKDDTTATKSSMAFETSFNGSIHIGARTNGTKISEDYIGVFNLTEKIKVGRGVIPIAPTPTPDWLPCPFPEPGVSTPPSDLDCPSSEP